MDFYSKWLEKNATKSLLDVYSSAQKTLDAKLNPGPSSSTFTSENVNIINFRSSYGRDIIKNYVLSSVLLALCESFISSKRFIVSESTTTTDVSISPQSPVTLIWQTLCKHEENFHQNMTHAVDTIVRCILADQRSLALLQLTTPAETLAALAGTTEVDADLAKGTAQKTLDEYQPIDDALVNMVHKYLTSPLSAKSQTMASQGDCLQKGLPSSRQELDNILTWLLNFIRQYSTDPKHAKSVYILIQLMPVAIFLSIHQLDRLHRTLTNDKTSDMSSETSIPLGIAQIILILQCAVHDCYYSVDSFSPQMYTSFNYESGLRTKIPLNLSYYRERFTRNEFRLPHKKVLHRIGVSKKAKKTVSWSNHRFRPFPLSSEDIIESDAWAIPLFSKILDTCTLFFDEVKIHTPTAISTVHPNRTLNWVIFERITGLLLQMDKAGFYSSSADYLYDIRGTQTSAALCETESMFRHFSVDNFLENDKIRNSLTKLIFLPSLFMQDITPFSHSSNPKQPEYAQLILAKCQLRSYEEPALPTVGESTEFEY